MTTRVVLLLLVLHLHKVVLPWLAARVQELLISQCVMLPCNEYCRIFGSALMSLRLGVCRLGSTGSLQRCPIGSDSASF